MRPPDLYAQALEQEREIALLRESNQQLRMNLDNAGAMQNSIPAETLHALMLAG